MNNILIIENLLTPEKCQSLIAESIPFLDNDNIKTHSGYAFRDWIDYHTHDIIAPASIEILKQYRTVFPEFEITSNRWELGPWRFKHFPPGSYYKDWHSEHSCENPYRIACLMIYLSEHNCGTEFYNGEVIQSRLGRAIVFPTFWTHTHRGQLCPENKSRYIMSAYIDMIPY